MKNKAIKKQKLSSESQILLKNFHPALKPPISKSLICNKIYEVFRGEDCALKLLELNLVNNSTIKKVNKSFLNHNYSTDILTFIYSPLKNELEGEIFISLDKVKKNAVEYNTPYKTEFMRVIIHGCLHMVGYNDIKKKDIIKMREKENQYIYNVLR